MQEIQQFIEILETLETHRDDPNLVELLEKLQKEHPRFRSFFEELKQSVDGHRVEASQEAVDCSTGAMFGFVSTLFFDQADITKLMNDIRNWPPFKQLIASRNLTESTINSFTQTLALFIQQLSLQLGDLRKPEFGILLNGLGKLCILLDILAKDTQLFTDTQITDAIANLTTLIASWTSCAQQQLASVCIPDELKNALSRFFAVIPADTPNVEGFLILLKTAAALIEKGHQIILSVLVNTNLSLQPILVSYSADLSALVFTISTVGNDPNQIASDIQNALNTAQDFIPFMRLGVNINQRIIVDVPSKPLACDNVTNLPTHQGYIVVIVCQTSDGKIGVVCDLSVSRDQCQQMGTTLGLPIGQAVSSLYGIPEENSSAGTTIQLPPDPSESSLTRCLGPKLCLVE